MLSLISRVIDKLFIFALFLLISRAFSVSDFVDFSVSFSYAMIFFAIVELGGAQCYFYLLKHTGRDVKSELSVLKLIICVISLVVSTLCFSSITTIFILWYTVESVSNICRYELFSSGKHKNEALFFIKERVALFSVLLFYWFFGLTSNLDSMMISMIIVKFISLILLIVYSKFKLKFRGVQLHQVLELLLESRHFVVGALLAALLIQTDMILLDYFDVDDTFIAEFSVVFRFLTATMILSSVIQNFVVPKVDTLRENGSHDKVVSNYHSIGFIGTFLLILFAPELLKIFGIEKSEVYNISLLFLAVYLRFSRDIVSWELSILGKSKDKNLCIIMMLAFKPILIFGFIQMDMLNTLVFGILLVDIFLNQMFYWLKYKTLEMRVILSVFCLFILSYGFDTLNFNVESKLAIGVTLVCLAAFSLSRMLNIIRMS